MKTGCGRSFGLNWLFVKAFISGSASQLLLAIIFMRFIVTSFHDSICTFSKIHFQRFYSYRDFFDFFYKELIRPYIQYWAADVQEKCSTKCTETFLLQAYRREEDETPEGRLHGSVERPEEAKSDRFRRRHYGIFQHAMADMGYMGYFSI
jgi:hypothetical protein